MKRATRWTDARIEAELRQFLAGRSVWPSYAEFVAARRSSLREAVTKSHGARAWAARIGVEWVERLPGYAPRWTAERVRQELKPFLARRTEWPSRQEFEAAGLKPLRDALQRLGGVDAWATEFELQRPTRRSGSIRIWDEQRLEQAIAPLVKQLDRWPTKGEFHRAGLASALTAVYRYGDVTLLQERLGVAPLAHGPVPKSRIWTEERVERELREYCSAQGAWPPWQRFVADGKAKLYAAASNHGGVGRWQLRLGLAPPRRRAATAAGRSQVDQEA
jgi:hypothetical protein